MCLIDFCLCINCTYVCLFVESQGDRETIIVQKHSCNYFRAKFDHGEYSFGPQENTTFLVYVYGFQTPFWLQVCTRTHLKYTSTLDKSVHLFVNIYMQTKTKSENLVKVYQCEIKVKINIFFLEYRIGKKKKLNLQFDVF